MTLGDLLDVMSENIEVCVWGIDADTGLPVEIANYNGKDSIDVDYNEYDVTLIESSAVAGLLDVTINYAAGESYDVVEEIENTTDITASDDEDDEWEDDMYFDMEEFYPIEEQVWAELGLYLDMSSVRFDDGTVFIYSDPNQENDADIWMGDEDAEITRISYPEYKWKIENIMRKPRSQWRDLYKKYLEGETQQ